MSKKRYRSRPGQPRTETEAMIRAMAIEILDGALAELNQEISVLADTVELYRHELRKRRQDPDKEWGRWQVAPGVAMRAQSMLRKLRDRRDKMLAETEAEVVEMALNKPEAQKPKTEAPEAAGKTAPADKSDLEMDWHAIAKNIAKHGAPVSSPGGDTKDRREPDQAAA